MTRAKDRKTNQEENSVDKSRLKVEYVPIDTLLPYANNAKLHPDEQIEQIKESIQKFGFNDPIAVWKNNEIIEGHGRLIAAKELGMDELPIIRLDGLTETQRRAYTLVHNKLTMNSGFDADILQVELDSLDDTEFDMSDFGFDDTNFDYLDDLSQNVIAGGGAVDVNTFSVTFEFGKEHEQAVKDYIASNGKEPLVELMLEEVG